MNKNIVNLAGARRAFYKIGMSLSVLAIFLITGASLFPPLANATELSLGSPSNKSSLRTAPDGSDVDIGLVYNASTELRNANIDDVLTFDAPNGTRYSATVTKATTTGKENRLLNARSDGVLMTAVVNAAGNFVSSIRANGDYFESAIYKGQTVVFDNAAGEIAQNPFLNDEVIPPASGRSSTENLPAGELTANADIISVGVLVDTAANNAYDMAAHIDFFIDVANQSYQNSGVDILFEVVAATIFDPELSQSDMALTLRDLSCGTTTCNPFSSDNASVLNWRDQNKADLVVQIVRYGTTGGTCGIAWTPGPNGFADFTTYLKDLTYNVNAMELPNGSVCPSIVVAHEMGHNFGLGHDRQTGCGNPYDSYACGHKVSGVFGTVMSYVPPSQYLYNLSNPNLTYQGYPIGVPIGQSGEAFAAQAVANVSYLHRDLYDNGSTARFTVTPSAGAGGSISPTTPRSVSQGTTTSFTIAPNSGYQIRLPVGGTCGGTLSGNTYVTNPVTQSCTVAANFEQASPPPMLTEALDEPSLGWATGGNAQWAGQRATFYAFGSNNDAAESGNINDGQSSYLQTTVSGPGVLSFYWKVSSELGYDYLSVSIDGAEQRKISGDESWTNVSLTIGGSGNHTIRWTYRKDVSVSSGLDTAWVDLVNWEASTTTDYVVTPSAGANGSISPSTPQTVTSGSTKSFTVTPNNGYQIALPIGGTCGGSLSGNTYTSNAVTQDCTVIANFEAAAIAPSAPTIVSATAGNQTATIAFSANPNGSSADSFTAVCTPETANRQTYSPVRLSGDVPSSNDLVTLISQPSKAEIDALKTFHQSQAFRDSGARCGTERWDARPQARSVADCANSQTTIDNVYDVLNGANYVVPVIFHVIYQQDGTGLLSTQQIQDQMAVLNEDFAGFLGSGFNTTIQFDLIDIRYHQNDAAFNDSSTAATTLKNAERLNGNNYLNIFTNDAGGDGTLGYAWFPAWGVGVEDDVITMLHSTIGGRSNGYSVFDEGRTLVHEIGHYLGLLHTFQDPGVCSGNSYSAGDLVVDTPDQRSPDFTAPSSACGVTSMLDNFMNYSYDDFMYRFTPEQTNRMICSLQNYRTRLYSVESSGFSATGTSSPLVVSGLTNGATYQCNVYATNEAGNSPASAFLSVTPQSAGSSFTVTPSAGTGGTINPNVPQIINSGDTASFTITASGGYELGAIGGTCPAGSWLGSTYTTGAISADCTVVANFEQIPVPSYTVTPQDGEGGAISPSSAQTVNEGDTLSFTVIPNDDYLISGISGTCPSGTLSENSYTTGAIFADCTVVANFEQIPVPMRLSTEGELLIFPYYAAHDDYRTSVTINNTTPLVKGIKVAIREGLRGNEVLSWHTYLGPYEQLEFAINKDLEGNAAVYKDRSAGPCTVPEFPSEPVFLRPYLFAEDSFNDLTRTGAGYIEVIEMGQWDPNSGLGYAASTKSCNQLVSAWSIGDAASSSWVDDPTFEALSWQGGGLRGSADIASISLGFSPAPPGFTYMSYEATAIANFARYRQPAEYHTTPGDLTHAMRNGSLQFERTFDGVTTIFTAETGLDALSALLVQSQVQENRPASASEGAAKSWLMSMPTKYHYESTGAMGPFVATWNSSLSNACEFFEVGDAPPTSAANVDLVGRENISLCAATNWVVTPESNNPPISPPEWLSSTVNRPPSEITTAKMVKITASDSGDSRRIRVEADYGGTELVGVPVLSVPVYTNLLPGEPPTSGTFEESLLRFLPSISVEVASIIRTEVDSAEVRFLSSNSGSLDVEYHEVTCLGRGSDQSSALRNVAESSPVILSGIQPQATYNCRLVATTANGTSAPQIFMLEPLTLPSTPVIIQSEVANGEIYLYVSGSNGGLVILEYQAVCTDGVNSYSGSSVGPSIVVGGLTNGTSYQCQVRMRNALGWSGYSPYGTSIAPEEGVSGLPLWLLLQVLQE